MSSDSDQDAKQCTIIRLCYEGGGITVFGREENGVWSYWHEGGAMQEDVDDEGNDWKYWTSEPVANLADALRGKWTMMSPGGIHPSFLSWFHEQYEIQRATLSEGQRGMQMDRHERWQEVFLECADRAKKRAHDANGDEFPNR